MSELNASVAKALRTMLAAAVGAAALFAAVAVVAICAAAIFSRSNPAPGYCVRHEGLKIENGVRTVRQTHIECPPANASDQDISMELES